MTPPTGSRDTSTEPVTLDALADLPRPGSPDALTLDQFLADPRVASLAWPDQVVEQFLVDHGTDDGVYAAYGHLDLRSVTWSLERLLAHHLRHVPTDEAGQAGLDEVAEDPEHALAQRPEEERRHWEQHGTWLVPPVLVDRSLLVPPGEGLQIVDGRMRLGILRGRMRERRIVARRHEVWVGRPAVAT